MAYIIMAYDERGKCWRYYNEGVGGVRLRAQATTYQCLEDAQAARDKMPDTRTKIWYEGGR